MAWDDFYNQDGALTSQRKSEFVQTSDWQLRMHLLTLQGGIDLPFGLGASVVLPFVQAGSTRAWDGLKGTPNAGFDEAGTPLTSSTDRGVGDIEARLRADVGTLVGWKGAFAPRVNVNVGAVAPTGHFIVKGDFDDSRYASVGRGVWWATGGIDVSGPVHERVGYLVQGVIRKPFGTLHGVDGYLFRWGPEVRLTAGPTFQILPGRLMAALGVEWQWRDPGEERITSSLPVEPFPNGGGSFYSATATVQVQLPGGFSWLVNARLPFGFDVLGIQPVAGPGIFTGVTWSWSPASANDGKEIVAQAKALQPGDAAPTPLIAGLLAPGKVTIVDYWAEWCEPCKKLAPELERFATGRPDVALRKVDATDWTPAEMATHLAAVPGLPAVDIYGADGRLIVRLVGPPCFGYADHVPKPAAAVDAPASPTATEIP